MKIIHILLIDTSPAIKVQLEKSLASIEHELFKVEYSTPRNAEEAFKDAKKSVEVVLFGEAIPLSAIVQQAKIFRRNNAGIHVFMFTRESEARIPNKLRRAGVDDFLNIMELNTPVFGWTFLSTLEHIGMKKKAAEFEMIHERLQYVNDSLAEITAEIIKPIGNLRAAMDAMNGDRAHTLKVLNENIALMERSLGDLMEIRQRLGNETKVIHKYLAVKNRT
ncbi:MAG: hypothetical protein ACHQQQ_06175 [Bacteroidota bacterium]